MSKPTVIERIEACNLGRDPERLRLKYRAMRRDAFAFLRGSNHLFYQDWPTRSRLNDAPPAWVCGDLHLENFGSYKGDNRLSYFDINDFDDAALAPCTWDLARFLTSLLVAAQTLAVAPSDALRLVDAFLDAYCAELTACKARWIERATASGMIKDLLKGLKKRSRADLLRERTIEQDGKPVLRVDGKKALPLRAAERRRVVRLMERYAARQPDPEFFRVLDVARRIAGIGSLGLERYVILVAGKGGKDGHYLLDLKHQPGSSLAPYLPLAQPTWNSEAERVVALQTRMQAICPAFLSSITYGKRSYVLRELLPQQDRLDLRHWNGKPKRLEKIVRSMGELVAWAHLRSGGRQGSAAADQWIAFARKTSWRKPLVDYALGYSQRVVSDWQAFDESLSAMEGFGGD